MHRIEFKDLDKNILVELLKAICTHFQTLMQRVRDYTFQLSNEKHVGEGRATSFEKQSLILIGQGRW